MCMIKRSMGRFYVVHNEAGEVIHNCLETASAFSGKASCVVYR